MHNGDKYCCVVADNDIGVSMAWIRGRYQREMSVAWTHVDQCRSVRGRIGTRSEHRMILKAWREEDDYGYST